MIETREEKLKRVQELNDTVSQYPDHHSWVYTDGHGLNLICSNCSIKCTYLYSAKYWKFLEDPPYSNKTAHSCYGTKMNDALE